MSEELNPNPDSLSHLLPKDVVAQGFEIHGLETPAMLKPLNEVMVAPEDMHLAVDQAFVDGSLALISPSEAIPEDRRVIPLEVTTSIFDTSLGDFTVPGLGKPKVGDVFPANDAGETSKAVQDEFGAQIDHNAKREVNESASKLLADYALVPNLEEVPGVSEVFEISDGVRAVRMYNFDSEQIPERALQEIVNALRESCDLSGSAILDQLKVIAVLPEQHPAFAPREGIPNGPSAVTTKEGAILINPRSLREEPRPENALIVSGQPVEDMMTHELGHVLHFKDIKDTGVDQTGREIGWEDGVQDPENAFPLPYGNTDEKEQVAESISAMNSGGGYAEMVSDKSKQAIAGLRERTHSGEFGPAYLRVNKVDLANMENKIGSRPLAPTSILLREQIRIAAAPQL